MECFLSLNEYFAKELNKLDCDKDVKAYIVSIFTKYKNSADDLSNQSITIEYSSAKLAGDFVKFQRLADYLFFINSMHPESLNAASKDYYYSIAQLSYYSCYRIIREWKIFEMLADDFIKLSETSRKVIRKF